MENYEAYFMIGGGLTSLGKLIAVLASGILLAKQRNWSTILMFLGSVLSIIVSLGFLLLTTFSAQEGPESVVKVNALGSIITPLPYILFVIGLLLFATKQVKKQQQGN
ncbi:hypothetical protein [Muricauda sp. MAR_2010_75]|jgi:hypothetical protein|uniref:hypothetical protein n=1 Tax=Allomuricauda sp. MAR_2010_75 TaxID=1250232 RepID=UPI0012E0B7CB|nr:hypothetical protein [Muricauda sp. MAR_2010_75]